MQISSVLPSADSMINFSSRPELCTRTSITSAFTFSIAPIIYFVEIYFPMGLGLNLFLKFSF